MTKIIHQSVGNGLSRQEYENVDAHVDGNGNVIDLDTKASLISPSFIGNITVDGTLTIGTSYAASPPKILHIIKGFIFTPDVESKGGSIEVSGYATANTVSQPLVALEVDATIGALNTQNFTRDPGIFGYASEVFTVAGSSGTITGMVSYYARAGISSTGSPVTKYYGLLVNVDTTSQLANFYGVYIPAISQGTSANWGLYSLTPSYLAGLTLAGGLNVNSQAITNLGNVGGFTLTGNLAVGGNDITGVYHLIGQGGFEIRSGDVTQYLFLNAKRDAAHAGIGIYIATQNASNADTNRITITSGANTAVIELLSSQLKPNLPTSNPGAGILWNNGGIVTVGT